MLLYIYVQPNAKSTEIQGEQLVDPLKFSLPGEQPLKVQKIKLAAPPEDGAANKELISFLAKHYQVTKRQIQIKHGSKSRYKVVEIKPTSQHQESQS